MLELALWKMKLDELGKGENTMSNKKRKIDGSDFRSRCRISCGADIVIQHVLPYLIIPPLEDKPNLSPIFEDNIDQKTDELLSKHINHYFGQSG